MVEDRYMKNKIQETGCTSWFFRISADTKLNTTSNVPLILEPKIREKKKQGTLQEMHPYMMNKYVQQTAKQKKGT